MSGSMVERVAQAIYEERYLFEIKLEALPLWEKIDPHEWDNLVAEARAAIEAMREPDNDILEAMHRAMFADEFTGSELPMLGAGFDAAIDAALNEQTTE